VGSFSSSSSLTEDVVVFHLGVVVVVGVDVFAETAVVVGGEAVDVVAVVVLVPRQITSSSSSS
jgi:hypothetical protein